MARRLVLIRHCATDAGESGRLVGSTDVEASRQGLEGVARLGTLLEEQPPDIWFCSPLLRATQTADRLRRQCGIKQEFIVDHRLREMDFGRWEMKTFAEICAAEPARVESWKQFTDFAFPGGEAVASFQARVAGAYDSLRQENAEQVGVITHGGVIRTMICLALGIDAGNYLLFDVRPCRAAVIDTHTGGGVLTGLNV